MIRAPLVAVLAALCALTTLTGTARAAVSATVSQMTLAAGCQPKGLHASSEGKDPASPHPGLPAGSFSYTAVAYMGGTPAVPSRPSTPCPIAVVPVAGTSDANTVLLQWNAAPGATGYKLYRDGRALVVDPPATTTLSPAQACPPGAAGPGPRCAFRDAGHPRDAGDVAPPAATAATKAASHPDLRITQAIEYGVSISNDPDAALESNVLHLPGGLATVATATAATCRPAGAAPSLLGALTRYGTNDPDEDTCPAASQVGTLAIVGQTPSRSVRFSGDVYVGEKLGAGTEFARLYVVLRPPCSAGSPVAPGSQACADLLGAGAGALELEKPFLSARAIVRPDGTFGIDYETTSVASGADAPLPRALAVRRRPGGSQESELPLQVQRQSLTLFGSADQATADPADDKSFVSLPTSCAVKTLSTDIRTHLDATKLNASTPLQATSCESVPFSPVLDAVVDATGQTQPNGHPSLVATIAQGNDEAATRSVQITLPPGLGTNVVAVGNACTPAQLDASACPPAAQVGTATATTAWLPEALAGPVFLVENARNQPKLAVALDGAAKVRVDGAISFDATNTRIVKTLRGLPEAVLSTFVLTIGGGPGGLLQNSRDLCRGLGNADAVFQGHNDAIVRSSSSVTLRGTPPCQPGGGEYYGLARAKPPKVAVKVTGVRSGRPKVTIAARKGGDAPRNRIRTAKATFARGLRFRRNARARVSVRTIRKVRTFTLRGRVLTVRRVPGGSANRLTVRTKSRGLKASRRLRSRGRSRRLAFRFKVRVRGGRSFTITKRVKPRS